MGILALLVLLQLAASIAGGFLLARKGVWTALSPSLVLPVGTLLLAGGLGFAGDYQAESWARALPFVAAGVFAMAVTGAIVALVAYRLNQ